MASTSMDVEVEVTVNGNGFDTPSELKITNGGEIPTCTLTFPAGMNSRYKVLKRDIVRVYAGLDYVGEYPVFTGHMDSDPAKFSTSLELQGSLNRAVNDKCFVNAFDNYEGQTVENAILTVFSQVSELAWMTPYLEATSPVNHIPKDIKFENGTSKFDLMKQFREFGFDPLTLSKYTFFQHGDEFHFRKIPDPNTATPSITLPYGDKLLNFEFDSGSDQGYNYSRVKGKDGFIGEYRNEHRIDVDSLKEMEIMVDDTIPNGGEAYEVARANVLTSLFTKMPLNINSHLLLEAIPNFTVIAITGAPFGLSDNYLIRTKNISIGEGMFDVQCQVTTPTDVFSNMVSQLLSINRASSMN